MSRRFYGRGGRGEGPKLDDARDALAMAAHDEYKDR